MRIQTSCCLAFSAGGKYGGSGAFRRNADASVEKYNMMFPTISRRSLFTGMMKSRRTLCIKVNTQKQPPWRPVSPCTYIVLVQMRVTRWTKVHAPFLSRGNTSHTMQLVQYRLQARQNRTIKLDRERALQTRLMLRLLEQVLQFK